MKSSSVKKSLCITMILIFILGFCNVFADRGTFVMRPKKMKENINVYDTGQKAIIAWNRNQEIMILSTDKYASKDAKVLEFMPLPSKPSRVEKMDVKCFREVASLIARHRPRVSEAMKSRTGNGGRGKSAPRAEQAVRIVFHKKIGAHDITIAKTKNLNAFIDWIKEFVAKQGMEYDEKDFTELKPIVRGYISKGYQYYVFDVIELTTQKKTVEPILYQFKSKNVYFPLRVTLLSRGVTTIALYLFTPFKTDIWGTKSGFVSGFYTVKGKASYEHPIKFQVTDYDMRRVSKEISKLFNGCSEKIWFSAAKFHGQTSKLTRDFVIKPAVYMGEDR
ncbi:MAG: DUF2330 domain-containing protein [Candidatus Eremiobacteraeota bacterium]|nr:DUF2330 domain-containing protein [Candidatus Eremiobacteraeota bacterium]